MTTVDVVVPNYNYGCYLAECVRSVLEQDGPQVRVLIVDNASSDDSADIARKLRDEDARVTLVLREKNLGPHASFNEGIDWAEADYFLLLFADDLLIPGALKRAITIMERDRSIAFTYGGDVPVKGNMPIPEIEPQADEAPFCLHEGRAFIERFCRQGVFQIPGPSIVVRTSVQKRVGHYRPALAHSDDYEIWLRLAMHGRVAELDCIQAGIRVHGANRSSQLWAHQSEHIQHTAYALESFFAHEGGQMEGSDALHRVGKKGIAQRAYWSAVSHALRGNSEALDLWKLAFAISPRTVVLPPFGYLLQRPDTITRVMSMLGFKRPNKDLKPADPVA